MKLYFIIWIALVSLTGTVTSSLERTNFNSNLIQRLLEYSTRRLVEHLLDDEIIMSRNILSSAGDDRAPIERDGREATMMYTHRLSQLRDKAAARTVAKLLYGKSNTAGDGDVLDSSCIHTAMRTVKNISEFLEALHYCAL